MLCYLLFWEILGFIIHFYIIFGTNLLTGGPAQNSCFCLFQCFEEKEYQTESKQNETNWRSYLWKESYQKSFECTSGKKGGSHEGGGRAHPPRARPLPRGSLVPFLTCTPSRLDHVFSKKITPEGFSPFGLRLIFLFFETLK